MYQADSFFTLSLGGRIGLGVISFILALLTLYVYKKTSDRFNVVLKMIIAVVCICVFTWLTPQIYYTYYILIFTDLPWQVVIKYPPTPIDVLKIITFTGNSNLSEHSKGILFWIMVVIGLMRVIRRKF